MYAFTSALAETAAILSISNLNAHADIAKFNPILLFGAVALTELWKPGIWVFLVIHTVNQREPSFSIPTQLGSVSLGLGLGTGWEEAGAWEGTWQWEGHEHGRGQFDRGL